MLATLKQLGNKINLNVFVNKEDNTDMIFAPILATESMLEEEKLAEEMSDDYTDRGLVLTIPDMPSMPEGGDINLLRAVYEKANDTITDVEKELDRMEKRSIKLRIIKEAHQEMLDVATKYVNLLTATTAQ